MTNPSQIAGGYPDKTDPDAAVVTSPAPGHALGRWGHFVRESRRLSGWVLVAVVGFYLAYTAHLSAAIVIYPFAMARLALLARGRAAAYSGLAVGLLIALGNLTFFFSIFSWGAIALWYVFAFWLGLFVLGASACLQRWRRWGWCLVPCLWTGLEYFRSELYYLRFSWLNCGYAFSEAPWLTPLHTLGMYGTGFVFACVACGAAWLWATRKLGALALLATSALSFSCLNWREAGEPTDPGTQIQVTGVQMEAPAEPEVLVRLETAYRQHPATDLFVLSEYTFMGEVPARVKAWCAKRQRYLIAGGEDPAPGGNYYNTCFVISPDGKVVFRQAKSVPIQFFKDGLPAPGQRLWESPWGKIGICICYDLSYRKVTDRLVRLGAEAIIVPTMDVMDWGRRQHELHARVAPIRAAEYGLPIFRLASSGISQCVTRAGKVAATTPCPGQGAVLTGTLPLRGPGHLPWDSWLAPACARLSVLLLVWFALERATARFRPRPQTSPRP